MCFGCVLRTPRAVFTAVQLCCKAFCAVVSAGLLRRAPGAVRCWHACVREPCGCAFAHPRARVCIPCVICLCRRCECVRVHVTNQHAANANLLWAPGHLHTTTRHTHSQKDVLTDLAHTHAPQRTEHNAHITAHRAQRTEHRTQAHTIQSTEEHRAQAHTEQRTTHSAQNTARSAQPAAHSQQRTAHRAQAHTVQRAQAHTVQRISTRHLAGRLAPIVTAKKFARTVRALENVAKCDPTNRALERRCLIIPQLASLRLRDLCLHRTLATAWRLPRRGQRRNQRSSHRAARRGLRDNISENEILLSDRVETAIGLETYWKSDFNPK